MIGSFIQFVYTCWLLTTRELIDHSKVEVLSWCIADGLPHKSLHYINVPLRNIPMLLRPGYFSPYGYDITYIPLIKRINNIYSKKIFGGLWDTPHFKLTTHISLWIGSLTLQGFEGGAFSWCWRPTNTVVLWMSDLKCARSYWSTDAWNLFYFR